MTSVTYYEETKNLLDVNVAMSLAFVAIPPLLPAVNAAIYGAFGLGPMALDFEVQLSAAVGISIIPPNVWIVGQLKAMADIVAGIAAGAILPTIAISANLALAADLTAKLAGINLAIGVTLSVLPPIVGLFAQIDAAANAQVGYLVWQGTAADVDAEIAGKVKNLATGNGGTAGGDVWVIALVFGSQATFDAAASMFLTA